MIATLSDHLWQSTLFAACMALLALVLRSNSAWIRYWLWFAAAVKFLVPFSLLTAVIAFLIQPLSPALVITSSALGTVWQVTQPFSAAPGLILAASTSPQLSRVPILPVVWAAGFAALLVFRLMRSSRLIAALRSATPLSLPTPLPIPAKSSVSVMEPGLMGIWRPVLLLPKGIQARLSASEMDAILAHELCHWRRRDNLTAAIQMVVEAAFWFYPPVWWLGARLVAERERACDESVLASGSDPEVYAGSILKVCRLYVQSPLACASGVSGANLKKRVEEIMFNRMTVRMNTAKRVLLATIAGGTVALPLVAGFVVSHTATAQAQNSVAVPAAPKEAIAREAAMKREAADAAMRSAVTKREAADAAMRSAVTKREAAEAATKDAVMKRDAAEAATKAAMGKENGAR